MTLQFGAMAAKCLSAPASKVAWYYSEKKMKKSLLWAQTFQVRNSPPPPRESPAVTRFTSPLFVDFTVFLLI
jgi:hypothetical protein